MSYKGYQARVEFDADDRIFFGRVARIEDKVGFHADTVDDLIAAFHEAVDDYLETCAKLGRQPNKPYSDKLMFRVSPELHGQAAIAAKLAGKSLNSWAQEPLCKAAGAGV